MKIATLGAVCLDEIISVDGVRRESFGGILYNTAALSGICDGRDSIIPLSNVGEDRYEDVRAEFSKLPRVDAAGLKKCPGRVTRVTLIWRSATWREETVRHRMPPYDMDTLSEVLDCDAVHFNFINGTEIDLETLRQFRQAYSGLISVDVHQRISEFDEEGKRSIVGFPRWPDWAVHLDIVQCNDFELSNMFEGKPETRADMALAAKEICRTGPRAVTVTLGDKGALTVHRLDGAYYLVDLDELLPGEVVDATGCGDSFTAGFLVGMLTHDDPATALACGSLVAAVNARQAGIGRLGDAKAHLRDARSLFRIFEGKDPSWSGRPI